MNQPNILILPKPIVTVSCSEVNGNFGPFTRIIEEEGANGSSLWNITALAYFNSKFKGFEQLIRAGLPYMFEGLLPLQKVVIIPEGESIPADESDTYTLWEFTFKIEKDPVCCGLYFEIDLNIFDDVPTRGTVVMGQTQI